MKPMNALAIGAQSPAPSFSLQPSQPDPREGIGRLKSITEGMLGMPEAGRAQYLRDNWGTVEPFVKTDFDSYLRDSGGDLSDRSLREDLDMFNSQAGAQPMQASGGFGMPSRQGPEIYQFTGDEPAEGGTVQAQPSGRKPTDFDKTRDREFAKLITDWTLGGQQTAYTNLQALGQLIDDLENPRKNLTGPLVGNYPFRSVTAPESKDAEDRVGRIVQQTLKAVLGAQFAEREAQQLIERSYNRRLDESFNVERLKATYNELAMRAQMNDRAADYLGQYGTVDGFDGSLPEFENIQLYNLDTNSLGDVLGASKRAAEAHGWGDQGGLSDDEEARYQELLRKQAAGTLE